MSMFPHELTVVKKHSYSSFVIKGVYWSQNKARNLSGKGVDSGNSVSIVLPISMESKIEVGDMLLKGGKIINIQSVAELEDYDYVTVTNKEVHDVGSPIDNVVLTCQ